MIGLDTNVLCRYLLADDPAQTRKASRMIDEAAESGSGCFVSKVVLCELVWVLESCTTMSRPHIVSTLESLIQTENLEIEERDLVRRAVDRFRSGKADFADYVIGESGTVAGCRTTVTFDRALKGAPGFELL
jgi:predicted nucleic-acid-binding protein